jgi:DNA-binding GntR family transcriptional regulator
MLFARVTPVNRSAEMLRLNYNPSAICSVDTKMLTNIYDCRVALDTMVASKCVSTILPSQIDHLDQLAERHKSSLAAGDSVDAFRANRGFHALIYKFADNDDALRMVQGGWELVSSLRRQFGISNRRQSQAIDEHFQLIQGYRDRNRELVLAITTMHCELAKRDNLHQMATA